VSVALAAIFLLNAAALVIFPAVGHRLGLDHREVESGLRIPAAGYQRAHAEQGVDPGVPGDTGAHAIEHLAL
jgi:hypothetical protein